MDDDNADLNADQQRAFSEAHSLIERLVEFEGLSAVEVGRGFYVAAVSRLRKALPGIEVAAILYEYADDYATRHLDSDDGAKGSK